ncbi:branched-chain amino acid ABC transporter permease [Nocardia sp. NPDC052278]|uniref:branched-chain amino acid ABC transporter permease n=1 Tax=unclassified Nocardia TaxID=2637762 RepID=UPI0036CA2D4F
MNQLSQVLVAGVSSGLVIGGLALALAVGFQGSGVLNFAQGQLATLSAYFAWQAAAWGASPLLAMLVSVALSFALGMAVQRVFVTPIMGGSELPILVVTIALFLLAESLIGIVWGYLPKSIPGVSDGVLRFGDVVVTHQVVVQIVVLTAVIVVVSGIFRYSRIGLQMRAAAINPHSSELSGVNLRLVLAVGWGVAAAVGAVAGTVSAPVTGLSPDVNSATLLLAFAAAALGGFHSRAGAFVGGLIVGILTALAGAYLEFIGNDLRVLVPLVVIVVALLVAPDGIFTRQRKVRV